MSRKPQEDTKTRTERLQAILRLIREHPISRQEELQTLLNAEGYEVTPGHDFPGTSGSCVWSRRPPTRDTAMCPATATGMTPKSRNGLRPSSGNRCWPWTLQGTS